ncbi:MAG: anaerobic ribonucleoside-triphosphate reductase activating protein [Candidatus Gastranaerophilales bacterium]|nr:anaerobic ribonucleoside-triphosphate reductase activating protein [Candidatus Gastranaerophilales bacterium]
MNYHNITKDDMLNGDGLRVVLWVAGCNHQCEDCQNPITWDITGGLPFDEAAERELFEILKKPHISGITFSGGDPLHPFNRSEVFRLMRKCKDLYPKKTIWCYTGFRWEEFRKFKEMQYIDVLVDGRFVKSLFDEKLRWVGSSNQRIIDVQKTLEKGEVVLHFDNDKM